MLSFALRQHPDIVVYPWPQREEELWDEIEQFHSGSHRNCSIVTTHHNWGDNWAGNHCKISLDEMWANLEGRHNRAVLIRRENPLKRYLSIEITKVLGISVIEPRKEAVCIKVDPIGFAKWMVGEIELWQRMSYHFNNALVFSYEQLTAYWKEIIDTIQKHFRLKTVDLPLVTVRQETRPLKEVVENYDEIKRFFEKEFGWRRWLED